MKAPKIFTWQDALTFGLGALIVTLAITFVQLNGLNADDPTWAKVGIWSVPAIAIFIYLRLIHLRWRAKKEWLLIEHLTNNDV